MMSSHAAPSASIEVPQIKTSIDSSTLAEIFIIDNVKDHCCFITVICYNQH